VFGITNNYYGIGCSGLHLPGIPILIPQIASAFTNRGQVYVLSPYPSPVAYVSAMQGIRTIDVKTLTPRIKNVKKRVFKKIIKNVKNIE